MKSLSSLNDSPWQPGTKPEMLLTAAVWLILVLFPLPLLLIKLFPQLQMPQATLLASMAGLGVLLIFTPGELGFCKVTPGGVVSAIVFAVLLQFTAAVLTWGWQVLLDFMQVDFQREQQVAALVREYDAGGRNMLLFTSCVTAPLLEEILFRRIIYGALLKAGRFTAVVITSLLFAGVHFFLLGLPGLMVLGAGFQYLFLRRENLSYAVICHGAVNSFACIAILVAM